MKQCCQALVHLAALMLLLAITAPRAGASPPTPEKKLIEFGWDRPNTAYVRKNIRAMEQRAFDGVVIQVTKSREPRAEPKDGASQDGLAWLTFSRYRFQPRDYEHALEDLKATTFRNFQDNFILMNSAPGLDWFDPEWEAVAHNGKVLARVAKQGGCVGLMFDAEEYQQKMWTYSALPDARRKEVPRDRYVNKVRERGGEFMRAINSEFPSVKLLLCWGPATSLRADGRYDLLAPFVDGMCNAATTGTEIIDGYEQSYSYKDRINFDRGRQDMTVKTRGLFEDKVAFDRVMRVGFGLWLDYNSGRLGWHPETPSKNYFSPESFGQAVSHALGVSDRYVWIYTERPNWWLRPAELAAYEKAMQAAREVPRGGATKK